VSVHYTGTLNDDARTQFDSSIPRGSPFSFTAGVGQVIQGWDRGVVGMTVGTKADLLIHPEAGYGARGSPPTIPGGAVLRFEIEVLDLEEDEPSYPVDPEARRAVVAELKAEADGYFRDGAFRKAVTKYQWAINCTSGSYETDHKKKAADKRVEAVLNSNLAACCLETKQYAKGVNAAAAGTKCLEDRDMELSLVMGEEEEEEGAQLPLLFKILVRKANALEGMGHVEEAIEVYNAALAIKTSKKVVRSRDACAKILAKRVKQKKTMYKY
ncbi:peptidyl-prolyl cis-trans isomerase, FKBP-type, partial [Kipferlia bialata]